VVEAFYQGRKEEALHLFTGVKELHNETASGLLESPIMQLQDFYTEIEWLLHDKRKARGGGGVEKEEIEEKKERSRRR
jgi:hypothetical protein